MTQDFSQMTLEELKPVLAPAIAAHAAFDGWCDAAVDRAAIELDIPTQIARLVFEGDRVSMIDAWFSSVDFNMLLDLPKDALDAMKVRQRITALVEARLAIVRPHRESLRRALTILALPLNAPRGLQLGWRAADIMWRAAGDRATDYNHYTKRALLGSVYASTLAVFLNDESENHRETKEFLARRIGDIMKFEKAKAKWTMPSNRMFSPSRFLGRLRYPGK